MKKTIGYIFLFVILWIGLTPMLWAQNNCSGILNQAQNAYQEGSLYDIPDILASCLENGFTDEEKIEAYRLLTLTYAAINQEPQAREALISLLKINPEYTLEPNAPVELSSVYDKIYTQPIFYVGITISPNFNQLRVMNEFSNSSTFNAQGANYSGNLGFTLGGYLIYPLSKRWFVSMQPQFSSYNYGYKESVYTNSFSEQPSQSTTFLAVDRFVELPIQARIKLPIQKVHWMLGAGPYVSYLMGSTVRDIRRENNVVPAEPITQPALDVKDYRLTWNLGAQMETGVVFRYLRLEWEMKAGIRAQLFNHVQYEDQSERINSDLNYDFMVMEDDFTYTMAYFSLAVTKPFYNFYKAVKPK
ncbi:outer membrane beta-barrel protein [Cytophagales bacterium LB-30]|uniref:Outer membrane beta-barrel protein n=1 Tax=Shiella aurantiaca TaxID=3058365 RepID=A0ABT8F9H8_9BACT|nr:outer membrane beta-barrel protein [Shiella aurantiaca]MDN4167033.1 outer membrane beta-barrel protein [Shiella aurantiaca]